MSFKQSPLSGALLNDDAFLLIGFVCGNLIQYSLSDPTKPE